MGMEVELLSPGMQEGADPQIALESFASKLQQTLGGALEEQGVNSARIGQDQGIKFCR